MAKRENPYVVIVRQKMSLAERALLVFLISAGASCVTIGLMRLGFLR